METHKVGDALNADEYKSVKYLFPELLNKTRILMYNGQFDYVCNALGTEGWLRTIEWVGQVC